MATNEAVALPAAGSARRARLGAVDGLRGAAALAVVIYHYDTTEEAWGQAGSLGVELFFLISGFVILMALERKPTLRHFAVGRFARLYPAYLLSVCLSVLLLPYVLPRPEPPLSKLTIALNFTMLQRFVDHRDIIDPYWTLAFELWFYVVLGIVAWRGLLGKVDLLALLWLAFAASLRAAFEVSGRVRELFELDSFQLATLIHFGNLFIIGMMLYRIHTSRATPATLAALFGGVAYAALGRDDWAEVPGLPYVVAIGSFTLLLWAAASGRLTFLSRRAFAKLGDCSYSLYLLHLPALLAVRALAQKMELPAWVVAPAALPICVLLALASRAYVEKPSQAWLQAKLLPRADKPVR